MSAHDDARDDSQELLQSQVNTIIFMSWTSGEDPFEICEREFPNSSPELEAAVAKESDKWKTRREEKRIHEEQASSGELFGRETSQVMEYKKTIRDTAGIAWWPPKLRLQLSDLCAECQGINFKQAWGRETLYYERNTEAYTDKIKDSEGIEWLVNSSNCHFCRYLVNARRRTTGTPEDGKFHISISTEIGSNNPFLKKSIVHQPSASPLLQVYIGVKIAFQHHRQPFNTILCHAGKPIRLAGHPQIVPAILEGSLAKSWFEACKQKHIECAEEDGLTTPETRLINCHTRELIQVGPKDKYRYPFVALSYVWGPNPNKTIELIKGGSKDLQLPAKVPRTIEDAITVTKSLAIDYLWVDQFCIDQRDKEDQERQIRHMDLIYKCADVTVIAAAGHDCDYGIPGISFHRKHLLNPFMLDTGPSTLPLTFGIFPDPKEQWHRGSWHTRGWTFQEALLSRRRLVFSEQKMHFECKCYERMQREEYGGVESAHPDILAVEKQNKRYRSVCGKTTLSTPFSFSPLLTELTNKKFVESLLTYTKLATQYTARELSWAKDGLNAFRGIANSLQHFDKPVYSIAGIPFVVLGHNNKGEDNLMAEASFSLGLSWHSEDRQMAKKSARQQADDEFPTWSWGNIRVWNVTWRDEPTWWLDLHSFDIDVINCVRDVRIEFVESGSPKLLSLAEFAEACRDSSHSTPPSQWEALALCFKARILSVRVSRVPPGLDEIENDNLFELRGKVFGDCSSGRLPQYGRDVCLVIQGDTAFGQQSVRSGEVSQSDDARWDCELRIDLDGDELYQDIESGDCGLVLLRCTDERASVLVVKWLNDPGDSPRIARRQGILKIPTKNHAIKFSRCFSTAKDFRLI